jgi:thioredoxin 1
MTSVFTAATLAAAPPADESPFLVVSMCADWCGTCGEFREAFERMAAADAGGLYVWLDIEDDAALVGDIDIENFPTLAVYREGEPLFYGVTLPQEGVVQRTLQALKSGAGVDVPDEVAGLPEALRSAQP